MASVATLALLAGCTGGEAPVAEPSQPTSSDTDSATATPTPTAQPRPVTQDTLWLCRPGMEDNPCEGGLDTTVLRADGSRAVEPFTPAADPVADCFYVYPTVSDAPGDNAPLEVTDEEVFVVRAQAARFAETCRVYAPMYRQITSAGLTSGALASAEARDLAFGDVLSAFNDYLNTYNEGRPFVLIGHSQGALNLVRLIQQEVDGDPAVRTRLLSALLLGTTVSTAPNEPAGGSFANVPACEDPEQSGCVVTYGSYAGQPPSQGLFGRSTAERPALCVSPAALLGRGEELTTVLPTEGLDEASEFTGEEVTTEFVTLDGWVSGLCRVSDTFSWLDVTIERPDGREPELIGSLSPNWGLHRGDVNLALGDFVDLVGAQSAAWSARGGASWDR